MSYLPISSRADRIVRLACDARAALALARLASAPRPIRAYVAAVELQVPKKSVMRALWPASTGDRRKFRGWLRDVEDQRDDVGFDARIADLARVAA
mgnify:CR=1 FL=1